MISSEPQNILLPNLVCMVMQHLEPECHVEKIVSYLQGQGNSEDSYSQNMTLSTISSELLILRQPDLVWWYIIVSQSVLWKKLDCCFQGQGQSKGSKCLSRWYLLNHQIFCNQTWYCDALSWVGVSWKKICLLFSRSRSQQVHIWSKYDRFYCIFWTADLVATKTWFDSTLL